MRPRGPSGLGPRKGRFIVTGSWVRRQHAVGAARSILSVGVLSLGFLVTPDFASAAPIGAAPAVGESSAAAAAAASGQRVEVSSRTTETQQTFANPDGTLTLEQTALPVRARRGAGWVPIDTTLSRRPDGTVAPAATAVGLVFSGGGSVTPMARVIKGGTSVALGWPAALPVPSLSGDTATYAEVLPGVDLKVRAQADGFAEVLVVKSVQAARQVSLRQIRFPSKVSGGALRTDATGGFNVADGLGAAVFASPQPIMWDSTGLPPAVPGGRSPSGSENGDRGPGDQSRIAAMAMRADASSVTVTPDPAMLTAAATRFPVYIDPIVSATRQSWTMVNKSYPTTNYYKWTAASEGVGYNNTAGVNTKRLYWNFDTTATRGKHILAATFKALELFSYSCTPAAIDLWQTGPISSATTWNSQPSTVRLAASRNVAFGRDGCYPAGQWVEFNTAVSVADSAARGSTVTAFSLRAAENTNAGWKRFRNDALLSITYNTPPGTPTGLRHTSPAPACVGSATGAPTIPNDPPMLIARLSDADGGNNMVLGEFEFFSSTSGTLIQRLTTGRTVPNVEYSVQAPAMLHGATYFWRVRAHDGVEYSPYSARCYFVVDANAPATPTITTPVGQTYAVGTNASFTFGNGGSSDVIRYRWALNNTVPDPKNEVPASAPTASVPLAQFGDSLLNVWSYDSAGNVGQNSFAFIVANSVATGEWWLDQLSGSTLADAVSPGHPLTLSGGASPGVAGRWFDTDSTDRAVSFGGVSGAAASTASDVVDASQNFSVSAWVRLANTSARRSAVSKDSGTGSGFTLGFVPGGTDDAGNPLVGSFAFTMANPTGGTEVVARQGLNAVTGDWVHLIGIYRAATKGLTLYVNGGLAAATNSTSTASGTAGVFALGRGRSGGTPAQYWSGDIDDVHLFKGAIDGTVINALFTSNRPR